GVGSSILASLSEAGGNDQHSSLSKPLPPRSQTCVSRLPECVHDSLLLHEAGQSPLRIAPQDSLIFVGVPAEPLVSPCATSHHCPVLGEPSPASGIGTVGPQSPHAFILQTLERGTCHLQ